MEKGRNLALSLGGVVVGASTGCSLDSAMDVVEVAGGGRAKAFRAGRYSWVAGTEALYDVAVGSDGRSLYERLLVAQMGGLPVDVVLVNSLGLLVHGVGLVTSVKLNAPVNGYASVSVSVQGSGELEGIEGLE